MAHGVVNVPFLFLWLHACSHYNKNTCEGLLCLLLQQQLATNKTFRGFPGQSHILSVPGGNQRRQRCDERRCRRDSQCSRTQAELQSTHRNDLLRPNHCVRRQKRTIPRGTGIKRLTAFADLLFVRQRPATMAQNKQMTPTLSATSLNQATPFDF